MPLVCIRVHLVSSRALVRAGLSALLRGQPQVQLVGESMVWSNAMQADLVLQDAHDSSPHRQSVPFVVLLSDAQSARAWLDAGAFGIVMENSSVEQLLDAIRQAARAEVYLPPELANQVAASLGKVPPQTGFIEPLTDREEEVLRLLAQGLSNKSIAQKLYLSVRTIEGHLANVYGKLQVKSRTEAVLWATQNLQNGRRKMKDEGS